MYSNPLVHADTGTVYMHEEVTTFLSKYITEQKIAIPLMKPMSVLLFVAMIPSGINSTEVLPTTKRLTKFEGNLHQINIFNS